jgi:hypothetical protein
MQLEIGRHMVSGHHDGGHPGLIGTKALASGKAFAIDLEPSPSDQVDRFHEHGMVPTSSSAKNSESQHEPADLTTAD